MSEQRITVVMHTVKGHTYRMERVPRSLLPFARAELRDRIFDDGDEPTQERKPR